MNNKKKNLIMVVSVIALVILTVGVAFSAFTYNRTGQASNLVLGDIYMHYKENNALLLENALPGDDYSKYFEFTISGKNTYTEKDIWYDFLLTRGDLPTGKTEDNRIPDKYLKFKLVEVNNDNSETVLFTDRTYDDISNKRIYVETISKNTTTEINKTYRLYMVISNDLGIGNTESTTYTPEEYANAFASVKVNVTGDFEEKEVELTGSKTMLKAIEANTTDSCNPIVTDEDNGTIYFSGTNDCVNFNYVWYSGKLWRITAIYPDGTMKMITEDVITVINYGSDYNFYINEENKSNVYQWLNEDFLDTLYNYNNIIVTNGIWNTTSGNGVISTKLDKTSTATAPVGLLTSYEYYESYVNLGDDNYIDGYLYTPFEWWLLNRYSSSSSLVWAVGNGYADPRSEPPLELSTGIRPVVYLKTEIEFLKNGDGTFENPYQISIDKEEPVFNATLLNERTSGEYVSFDGGLYRIIGIENNKTKLTKLTPIMNENNTSFKKVNFSIPYGSGNSVSYADFYLNDPTTATSWYNSITENYKNMMVEGVYYLGMLESGESYKYTVCKSVDNSITIKQCLIDDSKQVASTWTGYVGLPRYGEMFASHLRNEINYHSTLWLITSQDSDYNYIIEGIDIVSSLYVENYSSSLSSLRPTIHLNQAVYITGGNGTEGSPFEIAM